MPFTGKLDNPRCKEGAKKSGRPKQILAGYGMRTYELHTFSNGKWAFNFVFDDSETALQEAKHLERQGRHSVVCVTEEIFDEATNDTQSRTIFRAGEAPATRRRVAGCAAAYPRRTPTPDRRWPRHTDGDRGWHAPRAWGLIAPLFCLAALAAAGIAALYGLQFML